MNENRVTNCIGRVLGTLAVGTSPEIVTAKSQREKAERSVSQFLECHNSRERESENRALKTHAKIRPSLSKCTPLCKQHFFYLVLAFTRSQMRVSRYIFMLSAIRNKIQ